MDYIKDTSVFRAEMNKVNQLLHSDKRLPEQIFNTAFDSFLFIDADEICSKSFFDSISALAEYLGESSFSFAVLDPDPVDYFYKHFDKYPLFKIFSGDTAAHYLHLLQEDPGGSPADALWFNSQIFVIYADSLELAIYADRELEIGVVALADRNITEKLTAIYPSGRLFSAQAAVKELLPPVFNGNVPEALGARLIKNYG